MSLKQPREKMSKSNPDLNGQILLNDTPDGIRQKIKAALTDSTAGISYDPMERPGVSNLIAIMSHVRRGGRSCDELARECQDMSLRHFKELVADCLVGELADIRKEYSRIMEAEGGLYIDAVAAQGTRKAKESAEETMARVRESVGLS